jgi:hypothetical protein
LHQELDYCQGGGIANRGLPFGAGNWPWTVDFGGKLSAHGQAVPVPPDAAAEPVPALPDRGRDFSEDRGECPQPPPVLQEEQLAPCVVGHPGEHRRAVLLHAARLQVIR